MINRKTHHYFKEFLLNKTLVITAVSFLLSISFYSQENDLVLKSEELIYSNPDEAIKIANHILNTSPKLQEKVIANLLLSKSYLVKGDYNNAIIYAFNDSNQLEEIDIHTRIENNIIKAVLLRKLYLDSQSEEYINKASSLTTKLTSKKTLFESHVYLEQINMLLDRFNINEAITAISEAEAKLKNFLKNNSTENRAFILTKERAYNSLSKYDSAFVYIDKTLDLLNSSENNNLYEKAIIYKELGHLYLQKKEYQKSEETLFIALRYAEILNNPFLLEQLNRDLAINYLASNQKNKHKTYNDEFLVLNNKIEQIEQESVNTYFNIISGQQEKRLRIEKLKYTNYLYVALGAVFFFIVIGILILLKSENKKKRIREIINYLEISRNNFIKVKPVKKQTSKKIAIPEETEKNILLKLKRFEKSQKYLNNDMSLAVLAGQFETNTKYLSEIINKHYNDNFNTFINKLRINYIIEKLKTDSNYMNYKISFLAEESGFSTHSSFATIFKTIIGMPPATFINLLKTEREELKKNKETK
ncbi:helix-turn-helix domain-containing protein [Lacinutrix sp. C3R15]|uniref:helix-turn-helix domain-containing protein n=1 Tax=Flavobacteriaceae TaxID=49546 RepID=UPI001C08C742|nr:MULTISPECIES: helix-turn-helix domain-containing protein [Flavobacteriaceae]MBU2938123.1 helix-turn-helix domain-containing protein [Lacinutrix sp. C3R15]MDO6621437.1 helix-turn-helix domain-containing protein [Oceanihabitans sp. 1_MG-2023]